MYKITDTVYIYENVYGQSVIIRWDSKHKYSIKINEITCFAWNEI